MRSSCGNRFERLIERGEIVTQFHLAKMMERWHGKLAAAIAHAAVVHLEHGKAVMREHLVERVDGVRSSRARSVLAGRRTG